MNLLKVTLIDKLKDKTKNMNKLTDLKPPPDWGDDRLSYFLKGQEQNTLSIRLNQERFFRFFQEICDTFGDLIEALSESKNDTERYLSYFPSMSVTAYLATIRLAFGGQRPPAYMTARGCLENALCCFHIFKKSEALNIWKGRSKNSESRKKF